MRSKLILALLCLIPVALCAQEWQQASTPAFTLLTDAKETQARELALSVEQLQGLFGQILHKSDLHVAVPLRIIIARPESYAHDRTLAELVRSMPAGGWQRDGDVIVVDSTSSNAYSGLAALFADRLLEYNYPRTQPWFDLGIEELFAAVKLTPKNLQLAGPHPSLPAQSHWIPVRQLFSAAPRAQHTYHMTISELRAAVDGLDPQDFAAESWTVMRWLLANQRLSEAGTYFGLVMTQGQSVDEAIHNAFGMSGAELDAELQRFAQQPPKPVAMPLPSNALPESVPTKKVTLPNARAVLAESATNLLEDPAPAVAELDTLMKQDQDNAALHRALAVTYMRQHRMDLMIENVRQALALEDTDPRMHYFYAVFLNNGSRDLVRVQSAVARLSGELNIALRMDPTYAEAHNLYGLAMLTAEKYSQAINELGQARREAPRNERYMLNMAQALAASGDERNARNMLALLSRSSQPEIARDARQQLDGMAQQQKKEKSWADRYSNVQDTTDPKWRAHDGLGVLPDVDEKLTKEEAKPDTRKVENLKGKIVSIECSAEGTAVLHVSANGHPWIFKSPNYANTVLIGPDRFDCGWHNVNASINYKSSGKQEGDLVTLEID